MYYKENSKQYKENIKSDLLDKYIGSHDGIDIRLEDCHIHGEQPHLILDVEKGYNGTSMCFECFKELITIFNENRDKIFI